MVFLLDSSDGQRSANFDFEKRFLTSTIHQIWENGRRVGLYTYGNMAHKEFALNAYYQEEYATSAIEYIWFSTGIGRLENAISYTLKEAFTQAEGDRECVPNILVVLSHAAITNTTALHDIKRELTEKTVAVLVIDMASELHDHGFQALTDDRKIIKCDNFSVLQTISSIVAHHVNEGMTIEQRRTTLSNYLHVQYLKILNIKEIHIKIAYKALRITYNIPW